jgi:A/G-specific adenine glycosylase
MGQSAFTPDQLATAAVERIPWLRRRLLSWFEQCGRSFPWREPGRTPYEVVVAEILLQRTTAAGVAQSYPEFIERYPSWTALAQAPLGGLEHALRPLGLWRQKARGRSDTSRSPSRRTGASCPTRAQSWRACRGSAPTRRAWCWPSCTGEPSRFST